MKPFWIHLHGRHNYKTGLEMTSVSHGFLAWIWYRTAAKQPPPRDEHDIFARDAFLLWTNMSPILVPWHPHLPWPSLILELGIVITDHPTGLPF